MYARVGEIVNLNNPLPDINETQYQTLAESFHNYKYDYAYAIMTVYFSRAYNPEHMNYKSAV